MMDEKGKLDYDYYVLSYNLDKAKNNLHKKPMLQALNIGLDLILSTKMVINW